MAVGRRTSLAAAVSRATSGLRENEQSVEYIAEYLACWSRRSFAESRQDERTDAGAVNHRRPACQSDRRRRIDLIAISDDVA